MIIEGYLGALGTYGACNLLFGLESVGTSLLWCGLVAGGVGGFTGSSVGGAVGEASGEWIYKMKSLLEGE